MKLKVEDHPGLVRDTKTKAIISEDQLALKRYLSERNYRQNILDSKQQLTDQVHTLQQEITELKTLVLQLIRDR